MLQSLLPGALPNTFTVPESSKIRPTTLRKIVVLPVLIDKIIDSNYKLIKSFKLTTPRRT